MCPTSSTFLPNHGALRAICDYSATDDLVGFHVAHPVVLPSCHPPLPRTIYWVSCRVNIVDESEGEEREQRSFENHLKSTSTSSQIQTQVWTESIADATFIHFFGSNDVTWSFCWSTLLIFQSNTLWQSKWKYTSKSPSGNPSDLAIIILKKLWYLIWQLSYLIVRRLF